MLQPKRTKYRKAHKGRIKGAASSAISLSFGSHGLKAQEPARITARQIEAARRAMTRQMKRAGRVWIRVFPDVPVSKKPRSEEHTSELQSLMRISYAVFCLKKKKSKH